MNLGQFVTNAPMTYELYGRQYLLVAANDTWFAFALPESEDKVEVLKRWRIQLAKQAGETLVF